MSQKTISNIVASETKKAEQQAALDARIEKAKLLGEVDGFVFGDFRKVAEQLEDNSVDLIFTDPPYNRKWVRHYGELAEIASRKLVDGVALFVTTARFNEDEIKTLVAPHLKWLWRLAVVHHGGHLARMTEYGIVVCWKPLLWFVKRTRGDKNTFVDDLIASPREKDTHEWQQSTVEAAYYIEILSPKGGLVFDPCCGGGTTAVACKRLGRRFLTCDIDENALAKAKARFHDDGLPADTLTRPFTATSQIRPPSLAAEASRLPPSAAGQLVGQLAPAASSEPDGQV